MCNEEGNTQQNHAFFLVRRGPIPRSLLKSVSMVSDDTVFFVGGVYGTPPADQYLAQDLPSAAHLFPDRKAPLVPLMRILFC